MQTDTFLKSWAYGLLAFAGGGLLLLWKVGIDPSQDPDMRPVASVFILACTAWYGATAVGILLRKKWGWYLFRFLLYVFLASVPIGTSLGIMSLRYMKRHNVRHLFEMER